MALLGVMLAPVDLSHTGEKLITIHLSSKVPFIEAEVVSRFLKPMRYPRSDMRMGFGDVAHSVFGRLLIAFTLVGPKVLPTPTVSEIEFGKRDLQHDGIWKS